jgi:hypothetical protein
MRRAVNVAMLAAVVLLAAGRASGNPAAGQAVPGGNGPAGSF